MCDEPHKRTNHNTPQELDVFKEALKARALPNLEALTRLAFRYVVA